MGQRTKSFIMAIYSCWKTVVRLAETRTKMVKATYPPLIFVKTPIHGANIKVTCHEIMWARGMKTRFNPWGHSQVGTPFLNIQKVVFFSKPLRQKGSHKAFKCPGFNIPDAYWVPVKSKPAPISWLYASGAEKVNWSLAISGARPSISSSSASTPKKVSKIRTQRS